MGLTDTLTVVGIDGGDRRKGFHAVALRQGRYADQFTSPEAKELGHWCRQVIGARVFAIDAPCRWSPDGRPRPCERQLLLRLDAAGRGPASKPETQPSPPHRVADHRAGLLRDLPPRDHLHLRGGHATAANKRAQGSELLEQAGIDLASLTSIDRIDAALCCLAVLLSSPSRRRGKSLPCL